MSDLNDKIKKLLVKAKETGDMELVDLATDLLNDDIKTTNTQQPKTENQTEFEFVMNHENNSSVGGTPVEKTKRANKFVDDGTESVDIKTPSFKPTERKRKPYQPVEQTCSRCSKSETVNPTHARENYVCSKCLGR
tara:strand:- start:599 stop:1006 length:408 start_codon:yes stop_codon:yes gene_type:complete